MEAWEDEDEEKEELVEELVAVEEEEEEEEEEVEDEIEDEKEDEEGEEEEEGVSIIYTPFITSLRLLFTGALSDVLPYTQNEFFPSTSVPFQFSLFTTLSA